MAVTFTVVAYSGNQLVLPEGPTARVTLEIDGGNPYVPNGVAITAAAIQTALDTFLGTSGNPEVTAVGEHISSVASKDGLYRAVWNGTNVEIWIASTGAEAGAIDLSADTTNPRITFEVTQKY